MTQPQLYRLEKVKRKIMESREILDDVMYRMIPLSDEEYERIRESYDLLCRANDKLY